MGIGDTGGEFPVTINSNMGCIEICGSAESHFLCGKINSNMGCIEI